MSNKKQLLAKISELLREQSTQTILYHSFIAEQLKLNTTDHKALDVLVKSGEMTAGQLAEATRLTTGAITGVVDRLENAGYVERVFDKSDRRRVIIQVIPDTEEKLLPIFQPMLNKTQDILKKYDALELETIADFIENSVNALKDYAKQNKPQSDI